MKFSCNRFALIPHLCLECKRYIWLEGYRRAEVWKNFIDKPIKENICKLSSHSNISIEENKKQDVHI